LLIAVAKLAGCPLPARPLISASGSYLRKSFAVVS